MRSKRNVSACQNGNHSAKLSSTVFFTHWWDYTMELLWGVLPHCETCGCTLPISSNAVWLYPHQNTCPTKGTNMNCLNMFHLIINPNHQIICFTIYCTFIERSLEKGKKERKKKERRKRKKSKDNPAALCHMRMLTLEVTGTACVL